MLIKKRHLPYRILVKFLYEGQIRVLSPKQGEGMVRVGELAKSLRCSNLRVLEACNWLEAFGYISSQEMISNYPQVLKVTVNLPNLTNEYI